MFCNDSLKIQCVCTSIFKSLWILSQSECPTGSNIWGQDLLKQHCKLIYPPWSLKFIRHWTDTFETCIHRLISIHSLFSVVSLSSKYNPFHNHLNFLSNSLISDESSTIYPCSILSVSTFLNAAWVSSILIRWDPVDFIWFIWNVQEAIE